MPIPTNELLRHVRRRLRQLGAEGKEPPIANVTRAQMMVEASRGYPRVVARGQADIFREITRFVLRDMQQNMVGAPYVLQAWVDGVYFYYHVDAGWILEIKGAKTFESFVEAEAFIAQNFNPDSARDSILVTSLAELDDD